MSEWVVLVEPDDMLVRDGESLLLYGHELLRLSPIPTAIAQACRSPQPLPDLAARLASEFGVPDGESALDATRRVVTELCERGVLSWQDGAVSSHP